MATMQWEKAINPYDLSLNAPKPETKEEEAEHDEAGITMGILGDMGLGNSAIDNAREGFEVLRNRFNLWTVHTDFHIYTELADIMELTEGVETFKLESPYRVCIGVGKMFEKEEVEKEMKKRLTEAIFGEKKIEQLPQFGTEE